MNENGNFSFHSSFCLTILFHTTFLFAILIVVSKLTLNTKYTTIAQQQQQQQQPSFNDFCHDVHTCVMKHRKNGVELEQ